MPKHRSPLAQLVRTKRKAEGMTQADLAQTVGVGLRFVRELESDKPTLRMDKVNQVLWLFGYALGPVATDTEALNDGHAGG